MDFEKYKTFEEAKHQVCLERGCDKMAAADWIKRHVPLEKHYQTKIIEYLKRTYPHGFVYKVAAGMYSQGGVPDILFILDGQYFGFEVKRPYFGKISKLQEETIRKIRKAGGIADVVTYISDVKAIIKDWEVWREHDEKS